MYFVVTFSRYTLLGLDLPDKQLIVDKIAFMMRALFYTFFIFILYDPKVFELINIFYIEITLYSIVFIMQFFLMFQVLRSIYSSKKSLSNK